MNVTWDVLNTKTLGFRTVLGKPDGDGPQEETVEQLFSFRGDWTVVQSFFALVGRLPAEEQSFLSRYGQFENRVSVQQFTGAVREVNEIAGKLGSPESLNRRIAADGAYLLGPDPPDEVYSHIVWVSMQAENAAESISSTLELLPGVIGSAGPTSRERAQRARHVLAKNGGIVRTAETVARRIEEVRQKLTPYAPRLTKLIVTFHETEVLNQANQSIGGLQSDVERLQKQVEEAREKTQSWFGADRAKEQLRTLTGQIAESTAEIERKELLDGEMGDFFNSANRVAPALANISERLRRLAKVFTDAADRISTTSRMASPEQLGDSAWLAGALGLPAEADRWKEFGRDAQRFVQNAFAARPLAPVSDQGGRL